MPVYENKNGLNSSVVSEEDMNKFIPRDFALQVYCVGNGFGRVVNRMVKAGLLVQKK